MDLDRQKSKEAKLVLGAAVIDDVMGLVLLALVLGIATTGQTSGLEVARIILVTTLFFGFVLVFGERLIRRCLRIVRVMDREYFKLVFPLSLAFGIAWLANLIGLASIVGAFIAGLILNEETVTSDPGKKRTVEELIHPLEVFFAPIFFVLLGMQVNVLTLVRRETLWLVVVLILLAIAGKLVSGLVAGRGVDRLSVGIAMVPRAEVALIFASVGKGIGVLTDEVFSALVMMSVVTVLVTPVGLKWSFFRKRYR